jgi:glyoxylase-like metal-dependent hydrolase (beta-lactamase superfamily II)
MSSPPAASKHDAPAEAREAVEAGIHRLRLPTGFAVGPLNSYLIEDDPLTLVDAGPNAGSSFAALETGLAELGHKVEDLGLILVTHQHLDHIGLVGMLARRSGADVAALDLLAPWLATYEQSIDAQQSYIDEIMAVHGVSREVRMVVEAMGRRGRGWGASADVTVPLAVGEEVRLRDRTLTVLHRPGHSPSDTLFCDLDRRITIGGDHLLGHISSNPVITRPLAGAAYPRPQTLVTYLASLQATAAERIDLILPGHGKPIYDHQDLIGRRLAQHQERRDRLHSLILERSRTGHELAVELFGDEAIRQAALTISEVLGHVDLLVNDGQVAELRDSDGLITYAAQ